MIELHQQEDMGHVTNITKAVNYTHAFQCRNTNSQILKLE